MAISRIFERRGSQGWVILAGEAPTVRGAEASALAPIKNLINPGELSVALAPRAEIPSSALNFFNDFQARLGDSIEMIDPLDADKSFIQTTCQKAQLVLAMGGNTEDWIKIFAEERMPADPDLIIAENSLFFAVGSLVSILGGWVYDADSDQISDGIGWFPGAIFLPGIEAPASKKGIRQKIESKMKSYALNIGPDAIIGVGPQGKVEIWSDVAPEILLGQGWV